MTPGGWGAEYSEASPRTGPRGNDRNIAIHCGDRAARSRPHFDGNEVFWAASEACAKPCADVRARLGEVRRRMAHRRAGLAIMPTQRERSDSDRAMPQHPEDILEGKKRPFTGAEYLEVAARRTRGLRLRRAREGRHDASSLPQRRSLGRQALRRAARAQDQGCADRAHRHRLRRLHAQVLQGRALARGPDRPARRHRGLGAHHLRLDGPQPRLQGGLPQHAGRQRRVLRQVRRQRARLAQARPGGRALSQPRAGQSAHRPQQAGRAGEGRLHHHPEGDRRRHLRLRRQGGGHQLGAHPLQLPRPEHGPGDRRSRPWW